MLWLVRACRYISLLREGTIQREGNASGFVVILFHFALAAGWLEDHVEVSQPSQLQTGERLRLSG
jgi:hypothetical protein